MGERYLERGREGITSPHHRITTTTIIIKIKIYIYHYNAHVCCITYKYKYPHINTHILIDINTHMKIYLFVSNHSFYLKYFLKTIIYQHYK